MPEFIEYDLNGRIIGKWYSADPRIVEGKANILEVGRDEFNSLTEYHVVKDGKVVQMTQAEKDAFNAEKLAEKQALEAQRLSKIDDVMTATQTIRLSKVETAIDNIGSLADAKFFLKRLVRYLAGLQQR